MRSMVEGYVRVVRRCRDHSHVPLHQLRWSPSPKGEDCAVHDHPNRAKAAASRSASAACMA